MHRHPLQPTVLISDRGFSLHRESLAHRSVEARRVTIQHAPGTRLERGEKAAPGGANVKDATRDGTASSAMVHLAAATGHRRTSRRRPELTEVVSSRGARQNTRHRFREILTIGGLSRTTGDLSGSSSRRAASSCQATFLSATLGELEPIIERLRRSRGRRIDCGRCARGDNSTPHWAGFTARGRARRRISKRLVPACRAWIGPGFKRARGTSHLDRSEHTALHAFLFSGTPDDRSNHLERPDWALIEKRYRRGLPDDPL